MTVNEFNNTIRGASGNRERGAAHPRITNNQVKDTELVAAKHSAEHQKIMLEEQFKKTKIETQIQQSLLKIEDEAGAERIKKSR